MVSVRLGLPRIESSQIGSTLDGVRPGPGGTLRIIGPARRTIPGGLAARSFSATGATQPRPAPRENRGNVAVGKYGRRRPPALD